MLNLNSNNSSRVVSVPQIRGARTPRLDIYPCWLMPAKLVNTSKTHNGGRRRLVGVHPRTSSSAYIKGKLLKRHGNLYQRITDLDNIYTAYHKAKKGKTWQHTVKHIEQDLDRNIFNLQESLVKKTFSTSKYRLKRIYEPKQRDIYILPFYPDRIVQHAVMGVVEPIWDGLFIDQSYACRKGKGQHKGSTKCMEHVRSSDYVLKCDISKFYPSIHKTTMCSIVRQKIKCPDTLWLLDDIINSTEGDRNVPIGNYTSQ